MALENQPLFQAPSIPKMGKRTVSSSVFSNVAKVKSGFSLNRTKFSFIRPLQKQKAVQPDQLKAQVSGVETTNVASTLVETNRILVEIQKQLALDFANRIAEKKQLLELSRRSALKQKAVKKENFVERGKNLAKGVLAPFQKVIAPAKSIFDKLIEFATIVGGGILLNTAWEWLSKKENQEKLKNVFKFLVDNWKLLLGIGIGVKLLGVVRTIKIAFGLLKGAIGLLGKLLKRIRRPPGSGPGRTGPRPTDPKGPKSPLTNPCDAILQCDPVKVAGHVLKGLGIAVGVGAAGLGAILLDWIIKGIGLGGTPAIAGEEKGPVKQEQNLYQKFTQWFNEKTSFADPLLNPIEKFAESPASLVVGAGGYGQVGRVAMGMNLFSRFPALARIPGISGLFTPKAAQLPAGSVSLKSTRPTSSQTGGRFGKDFSVSSGGPSGVNLDVGASSPLTRFPRGSTPKVSRTSTELVRSPIKKKAPKVKANQVSTEGKEFGPKWSWRDIQWKNKITKRANEIGEKITDPAQLVDIYAGKNNAFQSLLDKAAARDLLLRKHNLELPKILEGVNPLKMDSATLKALKQTVGAGLSKGGTVFGQGSQTTDSVPAMLAPGEEVIRSSAANQFRPLLKDINDNAGRMFLALSNAISTQTKNNRVQEETNTKFTNLIEGFNKELEDLIQKQQKKDYESLIEKYRTGQVMGGPKKPTTSQTLKVTATPKSAPKSIQTYRRSGKSSGSGQPTIVNMPMPAINLAGNQAPEPPNTNVQEPSTTSITISSFDSSNPYISEVISSYGIFI